MKFDRVLLRNLSFRLILGALPIIIGVAAAVAVIFIILRLEGNVTDATLQEMILADETSAQDAYQRLKSGQDLATIVADLGESVESFEPERLMTQSRARGMPQEALDAFFTAGNKGHFVGPYEVRNGWYVGKIEKRSVITLHTIYDLINERVLSEAKSRTNVVDFWLPVFLCSCGLLLTFSAGLWNIGIEGQISMGAIGASGIALFMDFSRDQQLIAELGMAAAAGGAWALMTAIMKTRGGVNEIFGGVAMNFIASNFLSFLLVGRWGTGNGSSTDLFPAKAVLPSLSNYSISALTLYLAIACFIFVLLTLGGSRWGLQLRAMGKNARSAQILGIASERNIWQAMTICGMMAGLAGGHLVLFTRKNLPANVSGGIGFLALLVVLLASVRTMWVPFISIIFALFYTSSLPLRTRLQLDSSLVGVFIGLIVFGVLIFNGARQRLQSEMERRQIAADAAHPPQAIAKEPNSGSDIA